MKTKLLLIILISVASLVNAQQKTSISEPEKTVENFFKAIKDNGCREAVTTLLATNKWITKQDADTVAIQLEGIINQVGQYYGFEKIRERQYGKSIVQYIYIVKYERQPLKFIFKFYKPNTSWTTQSFKYEVEFMEELEEAGKAYRFKENVDN